MEELQEAIAKEQTDKDGKVVFLYTSDRVAQNTYLAAARERGYQVAVMEGPLDSHYVGHLERKNENTSWKRVDADVLDKLIPKEEDRKSDLTDEETSIWNQDVPISNSNSYVALPNRPRSIAVQARYNF